MRLQALDESSGTGRCSTTELGHRSGGAVLSNLRRASLLVPILSFAFLAGPALRAQSVQGAVSITVTDPAGAVIPAATLELKALDTNDLRTGVSQDSGIYRFVGLNTGRYSLSVTKVGF